MIFSGIGRSLYCSARSSFQRNVIFSQRNLLPNESLLPATSNVTISHVDGGLGLVRGYVCTSVGTGKQLLSSSYLSNFNFVLSNPRVRGFFLSKAPNTKKNENYYPNDKKEIPKANENKSGSKGDSSSGEQGNSQEGWGRQILSFMGRSLFAPFILVSLLVGYCEYKEVLISLRFQHLLYLLQVDMQVLLSHCLVTDHNWNLLHYVTSGIVMLPSILRTHHANKILLHYSYLSIMILLSVLSIILVFESPMMYFSIPAMQWS